jgi:hypothetical protein
MPTSLFAPDFQAVLDEAKQTGGLQGGLFPSPQDWRDQFALRPLHTVRVTLQPSEVQILGR